MNIVTTTPTVAHTAAPLAVLASGTIDIDHAIHLGATELLPFLEQGSPITTATLRTDSFGGTDAQGFWVWKDAYEALEAARVQVASMLRNLGIDNMPTLTPEEAWTGLVDGRIGLQLADGLVLRRSRVMNDYRVELIGFTDAMVPRLKSLGLIAEIISRKLRLFIPTGGQGSAMLASLLERHTLVGVTDRAAAA